MASDRLVHDTTVTHDLESIANEGSPHPVGDVKPIRDAVYYFDHIVFQVENTLFRVPKNGFTVAGSFFETLFSLPRSNGEERQLEGTDDQHPLILEGISQGYFRGFLGAMFPLTATLRYDEWLGALHLATQWDFIEIRNKAISALSILIQDRGVVDNILLGKRYRVKQWFIDGCMTLVQHTEALSVAQLCDWLEVLAIAKLLSIREKK